MIRRYYITWSGDFVEAEDGPITFYSDYVRELLTKKRCTCWRCLGFKEDPYSKDIIEDGFGSMWSAYCAMCGKKTMEVVRPGKVQCSNCG